MLSIRLQRVGKKNRPAFRMVLTDKRRASKSGSFLEWLGSVDRIAKTRSIDKDRVVYWISKGAQPTDTAHNILVSEGIITGEKRANHSLHTSKKTQKKRDDAAANTAKADESAKAPAAVAEEVTKATEESPAETPAPEATTESVAAPEEAPEAAPEIKPAAEAAPEEAKKEDGTSEAAPAA